MALTVSGRCLAVTLAFAMLVGCAHAASGDPQSPQPQSATRVARTRAQRKIDSHLLSEIDRRQRLVTGSSAPSDNPLLKIDDKDRVFVDLRVVVTPALEGEVRRLDGIIVSTSVEYHSIVAWVPILKLEALAERDDVRAIVPVMSAVHN